MDAVRLRDVVFKAKAGNVSSCLGPHSSLKSASVTRSRWQKRCRSEASTPADQRVNLWQESTAGYRQIKEMRGNDREVQDNIGMVLEEQSHREAAVGGRR